MYRVIAGTDQRRDGTARQRATAEGVGEMEAVRSRPVRAAVLPAPGMPPEIRTYPAPQLEDGGVLLRTIASEVCGTDVHLHHGRLSGVPYPLIPGHVSVGEVEAVRGPVFDVDGLPIQPGDVVTFLDV